jgi:ATP-dependent Clp protease ATP-binding subunit ClpA
MVEEPSEEEALEILRGIRSAYEEHHRLTISDEALNAAKHAGRNTIRIGSAHEPVPAPA